MPESVPKDGIFVGSDVNVPEGVGTDSVASNESSREMFNEVLRLHREGAPAEDLYSLHHLSFALDETRDHLGVRFVLWRPVALFLQYGFHVEIIEDMCGGHVVLANLERDAAAVTEKIIPEIEKTRRQEPLWMIDNGPRVLFEVVRGIADEPWLNPATAEKIHRMLREFKSAVRRGDYSGLSAFRAQLSELASVSPESDVRKCIEFLRASEESRIWPPHSAALASEQALAREWLTPEEDAAWSYL